MSVEINTNSKASGNSAMEVRDRQGVVREREGLRCRLAKLLRDTARVLDLEGRSQFK